MKVRHVYRHHKEPGDEHLAYRNLSEHVHDPRDLDADGNPPGHFLRIDHVELEDGEVEFDHVPSEDELKKAFPGFFARQRAG